MAKDTVLDAFLDPSPEASRRFAFIGYPYRRGDVLINTLIRVTDLSKDTDSRYT